MAEKPWASPSDVNRVFAKLASDATFKFLLVTDANAALALVGIQVPKGITIKVHENSASTLHFILPPIPQTGELTDDTLEVVTGGVHAAVANKMG